MLQALHAINKTANLVRAGAIIAKLKGFRARQANDLAEIPRLQLQRVDVQVRHIHVTRARDWPRITAIRPMPAMPSFIATSRLQRKGSFEAGDPFKLS